MRCGPFENYQAAKESAERHNKNFPQNETEVVVHVNGTHYETMNASMAEMFHPHEIVNEFTQSIKEAKLDIKTGYEMLKTVYENMEKSANRDLLKAAMLWLRDGIEAIEKEV